MDGPPPDDSTTDSPPDGDDRDADCVPDRDGDDRHADRDADRDGDRDTDRNTDPTRDSDRAPDERPRERGPAADRTSAPPGGEAGAAGDPDASGFDDPVGDLLPRAGVDSRWWYWIAAIPLYVVVAAAAGLLLAVVALLGFGIGIEAGFVGFGLLFVLVVVLGVVGLVLTILFPVATYVDSRAVAASDASWTPDPLVWGLAALATVVLSAFTLSFVLAVYYLYKRHVAVGTP